MAYYHWSQQKFRGGPIFIGFVLLANLLLWCVAVTTPLFGNTNDALTQPAPSIQSVSSHQETFTSTATKRYTSNAIWNTTDKHLGIALRDNIEQRDVQLASQGDAYIYAVWQDLRNDKGDIFAQRLDQNGNRLWAADIQVNLEKDDSVQSLPNAAVDSAGNLWIAWEDKRNGDADVFVQLLNADGIHQWDQDRRVNGDRLDSEQSGPAIALDVTSSQAVITWNDNRRGHYDVYAQRLDQSGQLLWSNDTLLNQDQFDVPQSSPVVAISPTGATVIAWFDQRIGNGDIYTQSLSKEGELLWSEEVRLNSERQSAQGRATIEAVTDDTFVTAWVDSETGDIFGQRFSGQGVLQWSEPRKLNPLSSTADLITSATVVKVDADKAALIFKSSQNAALYVNQFSLATDASSSSVPVRINGQNSCIADHFRYPSVAYLNSAEILVGWSDCRQDPSGDIFGQRLRSSERSWPVDVQISSPTGHMDQKVPAVAVTEQGDVITAWQDWRNGLPQIYLQRFNSQGERLWSPTISVSTISHTVESQLNPELALLKDDIYVSWSDRRTGQARVYIQCFDQGGNRLHLDGKAVSQPADANVQQINPAIAAGTETPFIVWEELADGQRRLLLQKITTAGEPLWQQDLLLHTGSFFPYFPAIATTKDDDVLIAWQVNQDNETNLSIHKIDQSGNSLWSGPIQVNQFNGVVDPYNAPALAIDDGGAATVVWVDLRNSGINAQKVSADGNLLWDGDVKVSQQAGTFTPTPDVTVTPQGQSIIVWQANDSGEFTIFVQKLSAGGAIEWDALQPQARRASPNARDAWFPRVVLSPDESGAKSLFSVVWQDGRKMNPDIYYQTLDQEGEGRYADDIPVLTEDIFYHSQGVIESLPIFDGIPLFSRLLLTAQLDGANMDSRFQVSNDGGITWLDAQLGKMVPFPTSSSMLQWRVTLQNTHITSTQLPLIQEMSFELIPDVPSTVGDSYEADDACTQASFVQPNGAVQSHTFHTDGADAQEDEDWVAFSTQAGESYILSAAPSTPQLGVSFKIYRGCGLPVFQESSSRAGEPATVRIESDVATTQYIKLTPLNSAQSIGEYQFAIRKEEPIGATLIVMGAKSASEPYQSQLRTSGQAARQVLLDHNVSASEIRYLDTSQLVLQNRTSLTSTTPILDVVQSLFQDWPKEIGLQRGETFFIYLAGPNAEGGIDLGNGEVLTPELLNLWLTNVELTIGPAAIVVLIDSNQSGQFVPPQTGDLSETAQQSQSVGIQGAKRMILMATDQDGYAGATSKGLLFSENVWASLTKGHHVQLSFEQGVAAVQEAGYTCTTDGVFCQKPLLNVNGNQINPTTETVNDWAAGWGLSDMASSTPWIHSVQVAKDEDQSLTIQADVGSDTAIERVEARIQPQPYNPTVITDGSPPTDPSQVEVLTAVSNDSDTGLIHFEGTIGPLNEGTYRIIIYAWDSKNISAVPYQYSQVIRIGTPVSEIFIPVVQTR
ncbi:MAG: hypothetical protein AAF702_38260 [Chloroflexota bacterium]